MILSLLGNVFFGENEDRARNRAFVVEERNVSPIRSLIVRSMSH